jgi:hypothetical protein
MKIPSLSRLSEHLYSKAKIFFSVVYNRREFEKDSTGDIICAENNKEIENLNREQKRIFNNNIVTSMVVPRFFIDRKNFSLVRSQIKYDHGFYVLFNHLWRIVHYSL